jgi:hypothetical protein
MTPEQYKFVYHIILSFFALILCIKLFYTNNAILENKSKNGIWCFVLLLFTILYIGLRNPWVGPSEIGDTYAYTCAFMEYKTNMWADRWADKDIGFDYFIRLCASFMSVSMFYLLCAFLYVFPVYITLKKWFGSLTIYALLIYVLAMSFFAFGINGVRNGLATSFFILR